MAGLLSRPVSLDELKDLGTTPTAMENALLEADEEPRETSDNPSGSSEEESAAPSQIDDVPTKSIVTKKPPKRVVGTSRKPGQIALPFTPEERALLGHHFLVKGRIKINVHTMNTAMYDPNFVSLFKKIEAQTGGNIRRSKHRIRSALRKMGEHLYLKVCQLVLNTAFLSETICDEEEEEED